MPKYRVLKSLSHRYNRQCKELIKLLAKRSVRILEKLMQEGIFITIQKLSQELEITSRAIRYDLELIDIFLSENGFPRITRTPNKGIQLKLSSKDAKLIAQILAYGEDDMYLYLIQERKRYILDTFINNRRRATLKDLAEQLDVSDSTINKDIVALKNELGQHQIYLEYKPKIGYELIGKELDIRNYYAPLYIEVIKETFSFHDEKIRMVIKQQRSLIKSDDMVQLVAFVEMIEKAEHIQMSDESLIYVLTHLYVMRLRVENGCNITYPHTETKDFILNSHLHSTLEDNKKVIEKICAVALNESEMFYIAQYFLSAHYISYISEDKDKKLYFQFVVRNFILEVSKQAHFDFSNDIELYKNLMQHFEPLFNRIILGVRIDNPLLSKVKLQFATLFEAIKAASSVIQDFCGNVINDEELAYLCMHFGLVIDRTSMKKISRKKIVIVCPSGNATSMMIRTALETNYYVEIIKILPMRLLQKELEGLQYDYIITTIELDEFYFKNCIKVNPILSFADLSKLNGVLVEKYQMKDIAYEEIIKIIKENCKVENEEALHQQLCDLLKFNNDMLVRKVDKMLKDVINQDLIELNVKVKDWKEAIRYGGNLLVKQGIVTNHYVEAMIDTALKIGPYIVLEKGIALPHATPQEDTTKIGVSIITLKNPIEFGHEENDPVHLVVCLASIDSVSHMQVLSDISKIFDGESYYQQIIDAKSKQEVMELIHEISNEK